MQVWINGKQQEINESTLCSLRDNLYSDVKAEDLVCIINGYQTSEDVAIKEQDEITFIRKGVMPSNEELEQMMCARHTPHVHNKVKQAHVAVAGLGGLGSNIAVALARTGVGHLHLIDFDVVEPSNLNRQQYTRRHLGMYKADALKEELEEINPYIEITADKVKITSENIQDLLKNENIVCEAFDKAEAKAMLVNELIVHCPEKKIVSASGMGGYESSNDIQTKKILKNFYLCGDGVSAARQGNGLMAPRVLICAGHQANMVLRLIIGETEA